MIYYGQAGHIPEMQRWFNTCKSLNIIGGKDELRDRNSMVISINIETSVKIQHLFIIKSLEGTRSRRNTSQCNKGYV